MLIALKIIFIIFLAILAMAKIEKEINIKDNYKTSISNIIAIIFIVLTIFFIYKI